MNTTMTIRRGLVALALVSSTAVSQQGVNPRLAGRLDAKTGAAVTALVDSARLVELPTEPLIDKALEGASKKAASAQIVVSVRTLLTQLGTARSVLGPNSSPADISAGAAAIKAGVPIGDLERVRAVRSGIRVATAVGVLADWVQRGVPTDDATGRIVALMQRMATDEQLIELQKAVAADVTAAGRPAAVAVAARGDILEQYLAGNLPPGSGGSGSALPSPRTTRGPNGDLLPPQRVNSNMQPGDASGSKPAPAAPRGGTKRRP
jgi:hypothetical protein